MREVDAKSTKQGDAKNALNCIETVLFRLPRSS